MAAGIYYQTADRRYIATFTIPTNLGDKNFTVTLTREYLSKVARDVDAEDVNQQDYKGGSDPVSIRHVFVETVGPITVLVQLVEESDRRRRTGEFFPYTCNLDIMRNPYDKSVMDKLQIYTNADFESEKPPKTFNKPCLINTLEVGGVPETFISDIKSRFLRAKVSRMNIKEVVEGHDICICVSTVGSRQGQKNQNHRRRHEPYLHFS